MRPIHIHVCNIANTWVRYVSRANTHRPYVRTQAICPAYPLCDDNEHHVIVVVSIGIVVADVMVGVVVEDGSEEWEERRRDDLTQCAHLATTHVVKNKGTTTTNQTAYIKQLQSDSRDQIPNQAIIVIRDRDAPAPAPELKHAVQVQGAARSLLDPQQHLRCLLLLLRSCFSSQRALLRSPGASPHSYCSMVASFLELNV